MLAPDGELLSYTDHRKAMWYVERGLATLTSENPLTVTLTFEPSGRSLSNTVQEAWVDDSFYTADRKNMCVCCGATENFSRFHVVPSLYRTHFPDDFKSHRSHDVVLLCFDCHNKASQNQEKLKRELEQTYKSPLS